MHGLRRFFQNRDQDRLLVLEVAIKSGTGNASARRDHLNRHRIVRVLQEELSGDRDQLLVLVDQRTGDPLPRRQRTLLEQVAQFAHVVIVCGLDVLAAATQAHGERM